MMKMIVLEYVVLTIVFFTLYFFGSKQKRKKGIVPVKDLRHLCKNQLEQELYDGLLRRGIYVSPSVNFGTCSIPIALEQYRIAIFPYSNKSSLFLKRYKQLYLRSSGWKVLFISNDTIQSDVETVLQDVLLQIDLRKRS